MSRQLPLAQRPRVPPIANDVYQGTACSTLPLAHSYSSKSQQSSQPIAAKDINCHLKCTGSIRGVPCPLELDDDCFTDEAFAADHHSYYDFYDHGYQTSPSRHRAGGEFSFSDDSAASGSGRRPTAAAAVYHEYDEIGVGRRHSRNNFADRSLGRRSLQQQPKDVRRVYPNDCDRICTEITQRCVEQPLFVPQTSFPKRSHVSSDRPQSSLSSGVQNAAVYGCGGKCQTFENVCYYFLQVAFTMGILIGVSLGIAGWVLRKSAARNLQVLLYIGAMLSLVCMLLLGIQRNARNSSRRKQKAIRNAKRAPIQMDVLTANGTAVVVHQQQQPLMENGMHTRGVPATLLQKPGHGAVLQVQQRPYNRQHQPVVEQPGIPWWRRKDLN